MASANTTFGAASSSDSEIKREHQEATQDIFKFEDESSPAADYKSTSIKGDAAEEAALRHLSKRNIPQALETLETGIIYFFYRPRVNHQWVRGFEDVARNFIVLRPAPQGPARNSPGNSSKFGHHFRLMIVPKKVFPTSTRTKEMGFVERAGITLEELQEILFSELKYETQTHGTSFMPRARIYAKGIYSIASSPHASYLAYILTQPKNIGPVQKDLGLQERGKWLVQSKNPKFPGPPFASLPDNPGYPPSFDGIFGDHRWVPLLPRLIDYPNAQFLLIGQSVWKDHSLSRPQGSDDDEETTDAQLEELAIRNIDKENHVRGVDSIYGDLDLECHHYPKISTMWDDK